MELKLNAQMREKNEKLSADYIPAVLYGKGIENQSLKLKKNDFEKLFKSAGESNLIDLDFGAGSVKVLVKDTQKDVIKDFISHVDFYQVNMKEKTTAEIPLHFIGEAKAVKELGGMLIKEMDVIEVECLPGDLVDHIDIDVSSLEAFDDVIRIEDIKIPETMEVQHEPDSIIVAAKAPRVEEEVTKESSAEEDGEKAEGEEKDEGGEEKKEEATPEKKED